MTPERRKAILTLSITLIIGILIGLLVPGIFHKVRGRNQSKFDHHMPGETNAFKHRIYRVIHPDSSQMKQIEPIAAWADKTIDSLQNESSRQLEVVLDSVRTQLKPILTDEQNQRLNDFDAKAKGRWHGRRSRH